MKLITAAFLASVTTITAVGLMAFGTESPKPAPAPEVVPVRLAVYNATMQYLLTKPSGETMQLILELSKDGEAANASAQAKAKTKPEAKTK